MEQKISLCDFFNPRRAVYFRFPGRFPAIFNIEITQDSWNPFLYMEDKGTLILHVHVV